MLGYLSAYGVIGKKWFFQVCGPDMRYQRHCQSCVYLVLYFGNEISLGDIWNELKIFIDKYRIYIFSGMS